MNISTKMPEAILDYWFAIEFLSQDKYPNVYEIQNIVKKHKRELKEGKTSRKNLETFIELNGENFNKSIYQIIKQETEACGMNLWGNVTFYIGKIKREKCIESIAKIITNPGDDISPEKSSDSIAVLSLQLNPDRLNSFGTFLENGSDYPEWVGSPLLVHRRCLSPMYDISNKLSYDGIMKLQTRFPKKEVEESFTLNDSYWLNVEGNEPGNKNHFVKEQGEVVCKLLEKAFKKSKEPDIYIISPFTTVVDGIRNYIRNYCYRHSSTKIDSEYITGYEIKRIGTVHTFQGKEANEVIFLLGCDKSDGAKGAIHWINNNIVNVAVTRAKYRLYVIGDEEAWKKSDCVSLVRKYLKIHSVN